MKLYFDESGYSGCIVSNKNNELYNDGQRHFVLGGILVSDLKDEEMLLQKYRTFKAKFGFSEEKKGSDLMTRENNEALKYFINEIVDSEHFFICNYDKIFYLSTLISQYIFDQSLKEKNPLLFYTFASALAGEEKELFIKYCDAVIINTDESKKDFLRYLIDFPYKKLDRDENNLYIAFAKGMLSNGFYDDFPLVYEAYSCKNTVNFINMTALGELLLCLKNIHHKDIQNALIYHDNMKGYEEEYNQSFGTFCIDIKFVDSKDYELIQLADNLCSVYRKCYEKSFEAFRANRQWTDNIWFTENYSKIINKIGMTHIKMVTPISDCVLPFVIRDIFGTEHNMFEKNKNKFCELFFYYKEFWLREIDSMNVKKIF